MNTNKCESPLRIKVLPLGNNDILIFVLAAQSRIQETSTKPNATKDRNDGEFQITGPPRIPEDSSRIQVAAMWKTDRAHSSSFKQVRIARCKVPRKSHQASQVVTRNPLMIMKFQVALPMFVDVQAGGYLHFRKYITPWGENIKSPSPNASSVRCSCATDIDECLHLSGYPSLWSSRMVRRSICAELAARPAEVKVAGGANDLGLFLVLRSRLLVIDLPVRQSLDRRGRGRGESHGLLLTVTVLSRDPHQHQWGLKQDALSHNTARISHSQRSKYATVYRSLLSWSLEHLGITHGRSQYRAFGLHGVPIPIRLGRRPMKL